MSRGQSRLLMIECVKCVVLNITSLKLGIDRSVYFDLVLLFSTWKELLSPSHGALLSSDYSVWCVCQWVEKEVSVCYSGLHVAGNQPSTTYQTYHFPSNHYLPGCSRAVDLMSKGFFLVKLYQPTADYNEFLSEQRIHNIYTLCYVMMMTSSSSQICISVLSRRASLDISGGIGSRQAEVDL